jgi:molecular chaperone GrpE
MIDPKGPNPDERRNPDSKEPHFEQRDSDRPMYATESDAPAAGGEPAAPAEASYRGWRGSEPSSADHPAEPAEGHADQRQANPSTEAQVDDRQAAAGSGGSAPGTAGSSWQDIRNRAAGSQGSGSQAGTQGGASAQPGPYGPDAQAELKAALSDAQAKAKESHEQYLRALADMENVRRRAQEDVSKAHKFAIEAFAESMLPVRDSLEMALTVEVPSVESLREGVEATLRQLVNAFERNRVVVIDPLHQKFDPHLHQAISMAPSKNVAPNHVVAVLQKGYMINDRILRPALVTVSQSS